MIMFLEVLLFVLFSYDYDYLDFFEETDFTDINKIHKPFMELFEDNPIGRF